MIPAEALRRPARPSHAETLGRQLRRVERQERYAKVKVMHEGGESIRSIARQLGMSRGTVYHYLRIDGNPTESQWPVKPSMLDPYISYLHRRWQDGCENAAQFVRELREHGYTGSRKMVAVWVAQRRRIPAKTGPRKYREHSNHNQEPEASASTEGKGAKREQGGGGGGGGKHKGKGERTPSSVQFSYFLMREPESLSMVEQAVLSQLQQVSRKMSKSGIIRCALQMRGSFTTYRAECRCE
ncbi:MAG: helix-turn-helix domain-containing protein [Chloroflexi bacterium]|nr:helix-turn-helix domain-containing protein [Chloroflexota bacterium]